MEGIKHEPVVAVGLMTKIETINFDLHGEFCSDQGHSFSAGSWQASVEPGATCVTLADTSGRNNFEVDEIIFRPQPSTASAFTIRGVVIGVDFHWQRQEDQRFQGALRLKVDADGKLIVINEISVEACLASVISSEMSAAAHTELLKAHAIISRSWLLAQLRPWKVERGQSSLRPVSKELADGSKELIRWYDREAHTDFDVCADDHCQRYQGITKATATAAGAAGMEKVRQVIRATGGQVLSFAEAICDARFSKSCGGMVEEYKSAWEDADIPYLTPLYDGETFPSQFALPLNEAANAASWIRASPAAFCNTSDRTILTRILPDFDQETTDFYRWQVTIGQEELQGLLNQKLGVDFGAVHQLEPLERGASGRITRLRIVGEKATMVIGKELEIRRALSASHLYSSAFVVEVARDSEAAPEAFTLTGAGWGHGVGLCQIGAALMAERGWQFAEILRHYYPGAELFRLYSLTADTVN